MKKQLFTPSAQRPKPFKHKRHMTAPAKETVLRSLPTIASIAAVVGLIIQIIAIGRWSATQEARMDAADRRTVPIERMYEMFPSRIEWATQVSARNIEMGDLRAMVRETNLKIDQLYQIQIRRDLVGK